MLTAKEIIHDMRREVARMRRVAKAYSSSESDSESLAGLLLLRVADKLESMAHIYESDGLLTGSATDAQPAK